MADNESFINKVEDEFKKVETEVKDFVTGEEHKIEPQVEEDVHDVEADAKTIKGEVKDDVKQEEALVSDAVHHPSDIPTDASEGFADAKADEEHLRAEVEQDVKTEEQKVEEQVDEDTSSDSSANPTEANAFDTLAQPHPDDVPVAEGSHESGAVASPVATDAQASENVTDEESRDTEETQTTDDNDVVAEITKHLRAEAKKMNEAGPGSEIHESETPEAWANRFPTPLNAQAPPADGTHQQV